MHAGFLYFSINQLNMMFFMRYFFIVILFFSLIACDKSDDNNSDTFNRSELLQNAADEIIIPSFNSLKTASADLKLKVNAFINNPTLNSLTEMQEAWLVTAEASQLVTTFNFGPAETSTGNLTIDIATFPVNAIQINNFIDQMSDENFNPLNNFARDTRGIYSVEYLIFDKNQDQNTILDRFTGANSDNFKAYLEIITEDIDNKINQVVDAWSSYRQTFIDNDGTSAGSSMSIYYNQFLIGFENIKNFKLGVPLGLRAGQMGTEPELVEAYYSGNSVNLIKKNFEQIVKVYFGTTGNNIDGVGFDDYLKEIEGGDVLLSETIAQLEYINSSLSLFSNSPTLDQQIITNNTAQAENVHFEMSKWTRFVKSDLSSLLGISITFSSGDGD